MRRDLRRWSGLRDFPAGSKTVHRTVFVGFAAALFKSLHEYDDEKSGDAQGVSRFLVRVAGLEPTVSWSQTAARTWCYRGKKLICRSLLLSAWSPAVSFALYPGAPAVVVVKDVVPTESSRGAAQKPPHGSVCIVTLIAKKVKLFFPPRQTSEAFGLRSIIAPQ